MQSVLQHLVNEHDNKEVRIKQKVLDAQSNIPVHSISNLGTYQDYYCLKKSMYCAVVYLCCAQYYHEKLVQYHLKSVQSKYLIT